MTTLHIKDAAILRMVAPLRSDVLSRLQKTKEILRDYMDGRDTRPHAAAIVETAKRVNELQTLADLLGGYEVKP